MCPAAVQAAVLIQAAYRGYLERMKIAARWAAAQRIQAAVRGFLARQRLHRQVSFPRPARKELVMLTRADESRRVQIWE